MDLQQWAKTLKSSVRQRLKHRDNLKQGYPQQYAQVKDDANADDFPHLWGQCVTPIKQRTGAVDINENRRRNMQLAIDYISGVVLQPGEIFSFWHHVPQPTTGNGFRSGPMLIRGKLRTDVGGGLCQISTTLFGAFLYANCDILERYNHSIDAHGGDRFFVLGQDAAVAYGYKDLMVRNVSTTPLQIRLQFGDEPLTMDASLWGTEPCPQQIRLTSTVVEQLSASHPQGKPGWNVEAQRWIATYPDSRELNENLNWDVNYCFTSLYQPTIAADADRQPASTSI